MTETHSREAGEQPPLFISYAAADRQRALAIADALEDVGVSVWIDRRGLAGGDLWATEITAAIRSCRALVLVCTAASVRSRNVRQEVQLAWDHDRPILPLLLEPVQFPDEIAYFVQGRQWIDAVQRPEHSWLQDVTDALGERDVRRPAPATPSPAASQSKLPTFSNRLVGRDRELATLAGYLTPEGPPLVTLTGPGGVGKTRLALEAARNASSQFPEAFTFVDFAVITSAAQVATAIAKAIGLREVPELSSDELLTTALANRGDLLLLLDNFEHVIDAAGLVSLLLNAAPRVHILVTSRESLRVRDEIEIVIQPLALPTRHDAQDAEAVLASPAAALFGDVAASANPGFVLHDEHAPAVAEICRRLDGLPLAIELAAARVRHFPPDLLLKQLDQRLPMLTGGRRDQPARQQTLERTILWSYDLLAESERALFRLLSVFVGGASFEAIYAVAAECATHRSIDLVSGLASLVDKSLLRESGAGNGTPRFTMLEVVREFGINALIESGESPAVSAAHARHFLRTTEAFARGMLAPLGDLSAFPMVDAEIDNYRAAAAWFYAQGDAESCAIFAFRLWGYFYLIGHEREFIALGERALELAKQSPISDELRGLVLSEMSHGETVTRGPSAGETVARQALELLRRASPGSELIAIPLDKLMIALRDQGRIQESMECASELLQMSRRIGDRLFESYTLYHLGYMHYLQDDLEGAAGMLAASRDIGSESGAHEPMLYSSRVLAQVHLRRNDLAAAAPVLRELQRQWVEFGYRGETGFSFDLIALVAAISSMPDQSARLFGFCSAYSSLLGNLPLAEPWWEDTQADLRKALGEPAYQRALDDGLKMPIHDAFEVAAGVLDRVETAPAA
jgi:predicted ATPase